MVNFNFNKFMVCLLGCMLCIFISCCFIIWLSKLEQDLAFLIGCTVIGGIIGSVLIYFGTEREEYVDVCYKVGEKPEDVRVIAVCDNPWTRNDILEEGDCYRSVPLNKVLKEATWEDLQYKTKDGYMSVE